MRVSLPSVLGRGSEKTYSQHVTSGLVTMHSGHSVARWHRPEALGECILCALLRKIGISGILGSLH
jgi:hypothetical protein